MSEDYEVAVIGAGLAGACAAALLARHSGIAAARIALLASESPAQLRADAAPELRVVAVSRASERVLAAAGAWPPEPAARLCAYERMCVWHESAGPASASALWFDAADIGEPNLGYIAENGLLQRACLGSFHAAGGALLPAMLRRIEFSAGRAHLELDGQRSLTARLVVGADGAQSLVRSQLHIPVRTHDYRQLALVASVRTAQPHRHTAWQRFLASGPLALLPLFDGSCSIVWSIDEPLGSVLRDCSVAQFNQRLEAASGGVLGATTLVSERRSFPLHSLAAQTYVAPRCALIGDAAHVIHPLAGQGANLGLLDAAALCEAVGAALAQREDPGALRALRRYEQHRRTHNLSMDAAMNVLQRGFAARTGAPASWLVNQALGFVNRSGALKRLFARQALGSSGELPALARARAVSAPAADRSWRRR